VKPACIKYASLIVLLQLVSLFSFGSSYYVATTGNDSNIGSQQYPWRTVKHAFANLSAGDTLNIRGGVYYESNIVVDNQGTEGSPVVIQSYPGETAIIDGGTDTFLNAPNSKWVLEDTSINLYKSVDSLQTGYVNAWLEDDNLHIVEYSDSLNLESDNYGPINGFDPIYQGPGIQLRDNGHLYIRLEQNPNDLIDINGLPIEQVPTDVNPNNNNINVFFTGVLFKMLDAQYLFFKNLTFSHSKYLFDVRNGSSHISYSGCTFNYGSYAFVIREASDFDFYSCSFDNGIPQYVYWSDVKMGSCQVSEAYPEFASKAITSDGAFSNLLLKNCMFKNGFDAIGVKDGSTNVRILHNYFVHFRDDAIDLRAGIDSVEIADNVFWKIGSGISMTETGNTTVGEVFIHHNIIDNSIIQHEGRAGNCNENNWPVWGTLDPFGSHGKDELAYWKVYNNTIVSRKSGYSSPECGVHSVTGNPGKYLLNNLIYTFDDRIIFRNDTAMNGSVYDGNFVFRVDTVGLYMYFRFGDGGNYNSLDALKNDAGTGWEINGIQADPLLDTFAIKHQPFDTLSIRERYRPRNTVAYTPGALYDTLNWSGTDSVYYRGALPPGTLNWLGSNTNWNDPFNWPDGIIPDEAYKVIIPEFPLNGQNFPVIPDTVSASCFSFDLKNNAQIIINGDFSVIK
jgi:hypothetical protein